MVGLGWVLGSSDYYQETWKKNQKTKINQHIILENNRKIKVIENTKPSMDHCH